MKQYQVLNLAGKTIEQAKHQMTEIASRIKSDKAQGLLVVGLVIAALVLGSR